MTQARAALGVLREHLVPYRRLLLIVIALQLLGTLASLYLPAAEAAIIDDGVAKGDSPTIVKLGVVMLAVTWVQLLLSVAGAHLAARVGMGFGRDGGMRCAPVGFGASITRRSTG